MTRDKRTTHLICALATSCDCYTQWVPQSLNFFKKNYTFKFKIFTTHNMYTI